MLWSAEPRAVPVGMPNERDMRPIFSPDGKHILTSVNIGPEWHCMLWQMDPQTLIVEHRQPNRAMAFSADGSRLISWETNGVSLRLWSLGDGAITHVTLEGIVPESGLFNYCGFAPGSEVFFATDRDGMVRFWESATGKLLGSARVPAPPVHNAVLGPHGKYLAVSLERENVVRLYECATGRETQLAGHHDFVSGLAFSPVGDTLASGSMDGTIRLWNTSTGELRMLLPGHMQEVTDLAFSPDGRTLATMARKESIKFWHVATRRELFSLDAPEACRFMQFSPDGRYIAVTTSGDTLRIFDAPGDADWDLPKPVRF